MGNRVWIPVAVAGVIVVVLAGIFVFGSTEGSGQAAAPAPTTQLRMSNPDPSGTEPAPGNPYRPVPDEQVDGTLVPVAFTAGRTLYIPVREDECIREEAWPRGEHTDRVEVEIRQVTTAADERQSCIGFGNVDGPYAVIELAEPLGDRRLVVEKVYS
jgi:hypothetical protein